MVPSALRSYRQPGHALQRLIWAQSTGRSKFQYMGAFWYVIYLATLNFAAPSRIPIYSCRTYRIDRRLHSGSQGLYITHIRKIKLEVCYFTLARRGYDRREIALDPPSQLVR